MTLKIEKESKFLYTTETLTENRQLKYIVSSVFGYDS